MVKLVQGVGINDRSYRAWINGKSVKEYMLWTGMLERCYSTKYQEGEPTYIGCTVSDMFKHYKYFFEWCQNQIGFNIAEYQLDKDLLLKHNKIYSEDNCVFIPKNINVLLIKSNATRGALPLGVTFKDNKFRSRCSVNGKEKHLGTFNTPELAFQAYKEFKEAHIKELAEKYKDTIDPRAYQALINYEVSIDD